MPTLKTLVWDVDDVLNDLMREWLEQHRRAQPNGCRISYEQLTENPPHALLDIALEQYRASLDAFRASERGRDMAPDRAVLDWFEQRGARARHVVLTATPRLAAPFVASWVMRHFGRWIHTFAVLPSPREGDQVVRHDASKAEYLRWLGRADAFIDDDPRNLADAEQEGVRCFPVPRPWNRARGSIADVLEQLTALIEGQETR
jgi:hypothetical protein